MLTTSQRKFDAYKSISSDEEEPLLLKAPNRLVDVAFFQTIFSVMCCMKCKVVGTIAISTIEGFHQGVSERVHISCSYCGELISTWTNGRINDSNKSPFIYNYQAVRGAYSSGMLCKSLQTFLGNLGLHSMSHTTFQKKAKFIAAKSLEVYYNVLFMLSTNNQHFYR